MIRSCVSVQGVGCNCDPSAVEEGWRGYAEMRRRSPPRGFIREQKGKCLARFTSPVPPFAGMSPSMSSRSHLDRQPPPQQTHHTRGSFVSCAQPQAVNRVRGWAHVHESYVVRPIAWQTCLTI